MPNDNSCFYAAVGLTSQGDGYSLTEHMLGLLQSMHYVDFACAFEVFARDGGDNKEFVFRRFTENLDEDRVDRDEPGLLECARRNAPVEVPLPEGRTRLVFPVESRSGPRRIVCLDGKEISPEERVLLMNLVTLYQNQVNVLDGMERDTLTGLLNRHTFDLRLMQITELRRKDGGRAYLASLDIDHFKRVNDTYGHLYGDEVLLHFAQLMERNFRYTDFLFRFGGEEFIVLLSDTDDDGARDALERFRELVATFVFPAVGQVTVSIGYTHIAPGVLPTTLVDESDRALYYAKDNGRNRVIDYEQIRGDEAESGETDVELF